MTPEELWTGAKVTHEDGLLWIVAKGDPLRRFVIDMKSETVRRSDDIEAFICQIEEASK